MPAVPKRRARRVLLITIAITVSGLSLPFGGRPSAPAMPCPSGPA